MASLVRTMSSEASAGHVLLGGGTGFIGTAFKYLLNCNGYQVTTISRMPGPDRITWIDVSSKGLPKGVTAVVNLAGQNIMDPQQRWNEAFKQTVWNSRVKTTQTLAKAITEAEDKPKVFVSMSGVGIYKPDEKATYDEYSDVKESFDYLSKLAIEWEAAARLPTEVKDVRQVFVRSGIVLGRNGGLIKQVYLPFWFCVGGPIGSGTQFMPWIHIYDMCHILLFAIENSKASGVFNGVAPQIITNSGFTKSFAGALHRPAFIPLPVMVLRLLFGDERAKIMTEGQKVHSKRLAELNFTFKYGNIDQAYEKQETSAELHAWHKPVNIPSLKHCKTFTDLLIHVITQPEYLSQLKDKCSRKKDVWKNVAKEMKRLGYPLTADSDTVAGEKCNQKLRNLKKMYYRHLGSPQQDVPKNIASLPELFGWSPDDVMYRNTSREISFLETSDITSLLEPRELLQSVSTKQKKLPRIIILKPGKGGKSQSFIYPATDEEAEGMLEVIE